MSNRLDYAKNKGFRLLNMYERLNKGENLNKEDLSYEYGVSEKSIQRDFDDLRAYIMETHIEDIDATIKYSKSSNTYSLVKMDREWLTNEEAVALTKIILESRAFNKKELDVLIRKIVAQISPNDKAIVKKIINSEVQNYVELQHKKDLLSPIWQLSKSICDQNIIQFYYIRQDGKETKKEVKPCSIMFNEFYFYLIAFDKNIEDGYPVIYRIDRISDLKIKKEHFEVPYRMKFSDGEFRQRVLFMYGGKLNRIKFEYTGVLEAMLDKVPNVKVLQKDGKKCTMIAESYGKGLEMWLNSQGDLVKIIEKY